VVTEDQRQKIYAIQAKFQTKIDVLAEEIKKLQKERDTEIEGTLSAEQKEKLAKVKAEAEKKKAATAEAIKKQDAAKGAATDKPAETATKKAE
jgi:hypothetical protein